MKVLLLGKNGQVGWELQRSLAPLGQVLALDRHGLDGLCGDLGQPQELARTVRTFAPDVIVNAAAYTAVDLAEQARSEAFCINAEAPQALARAAADIGALLVHYSSDYVFDGRPGRAWNEQDMPAPLSVYGQSKWLGEQHIVASGCRYLVFRCSWVYGARGRNFVQAIVGKARQAGLIDVVQDQWGAPTGADLIADVTAHAIRAAQADACIPGLYHLAAAGETSWYAYAQQVLAWARELPLGISAQAQLRAVATQARAGQAQRPHNSRLCTDQLQRQLGLKMPPWQQGVARMLQTMPAVPGAAP